jgi:hypothetical protein
MMVSISRNVLPNRTIDVVACDQLKIKEYRMTLTTVTHLNYMCQTTVVHLNYICQTTVTHLNYICQTTVSFSHVTTTFIT